MKKSIIFNPLIEVEETRLQAHYLTQVIEDGLFPMIEIWDTIDSATLNLCKEHSTNIEFDVSLSPLMAQYEYDLVSDNPVTLQRSIDYALKRIEVLSAIGIHHISISSPRVSNSKYDRYSKIAQFAEVIYKICEFAQREDVLISLEGFDVSVDKKRLLGTTPELDAFFGRSQSKASNLSLTWDLGHICLEEKDYLSSLLKLKKYVNHVHLSNYSLDNKKWYFGDKHLPFLIEDGIKLSDLKTIIACIEGLPEISIAFEVASNRRIIECDTFLKTYKYICQLFEVLVTE